MAVVNFAQGVWFARQPRRPAAVIELEPPRRSDYQAMRQSTPTWRAPPEHYRSAGKAVAQNGPISPLNCVGLDETRQRAGSSRSLPLLLALRSRPGWTCPVFDDT
jgi:hypothetical protein